MVKKHIHFFTWAQNDTPVHAGFWANLQAYAKHLDADLCIMGGQYKHYNNPFDTDPYAETGFAPEVVPYLFAGAESVAKHIDCRFDIRISPTASNPLSGLQLVGKNKSAIFGHPRYHSHCVSAGDEVYPKLQYTTGACTVDNYSATKAGAKAKEHHIYGFVVVEEEEGDLFHMRHVNARRRDGSFIDSARGWLVSGGKVSEAPPAQALRVGDSHAREQCELAIRATEQMRDICRPERIIVDDIYTHSSAGHRLERSNYLFKLNKHRRPFGDGVWAELYEACELIERLGATDVMDSNHHHHLDQWLADADGREDPENLEIWSTLLAAKAFDPDTPAFEWFAKNMAGVEARFWRKGELCMIGDVRHDHGHEAINGARGTPNQWRKLGCKVTTAHTHTPAARDGHYQAGHTSDATKHSYADSTKSTWLCANVIQDAFGKRQIVNIILTSEGLFRRPE